MKLEDVKDKIDAYFAKTSSEEIIQQFEKLGYEFEDKKTLLYLDDLRDPSQEFHLNNIKKDVPNLDDYTIVWIKDFNGFKYYIAHEKMPDIISFDHDLSLEHYTPEEYWSDYQKSKEYQLEKYKSYEYKTGLGCAEYLIEHCRNNNLQLPKWFVHSANPVGADFIREKLNNYDKRN